MNNICPAVLIPERTGIDQSFARKETDRLLPFSERVLRADHIDPLVRHAVENEEHPLVIPDRRSPDSLRVTGLLKSLLYGFAVLMRPAGPRGLTDTVERVIYELPVYEIL